MRPGFNSVRISTDQRHRVDCSLDATYELWTQIDPKGDRPDLRDADASIDNLADLGAGCARRAGALPIRRSAAQNRQPANVARMMRAAQMLQASGRFEQPVIAQVRRGRPYAVNLLVGGRALNSRRTRLRRLGVVDRTAVVLPATATRRTTIVIRAERPAQVDDALKLFIVAKTPRERPRVCARRQPSPLSRRGRSAREI